MGLVSDIGLSLQAVGFEHVFEFLLNPVFGKAEFVEGILMRAFEFVLAFCCEVEFQSVPLSHKPAEVIVELVNRFTGIPDEIAIVDAVIMLRIDALAKSEEVLVPLDGKLCIGARNKAVSLNIRRVKLPDRHKKAHVRGDRLVGMTNDGDEFCVRKLVEKRFESAGGLGGFGKECFSWTVGKKVALQTAPIVAHELASFGRRQRVRKTGLPKFLHEWKQEEDRLGFKSIKEERVVLFGLTQAQFVHLIPATKPFGFAQTDESVKWATELAIDAGREVDETLVTDARENGLIHLEMNEPLAIQADQFLNECRAATGRCDDKDRFLHLLPAEPRKEKMIQGSAENDEGQKKKIECAKQKDVGPAPDSERLAKERKIFRPEK